MISKTGLLLAVSAWLTLLTSIHTPPAMSTDVLVRPSAIQQLGVEKKELPCHRKRARITGANQSSTYPELPRIPPTGRRE